MTIQHLLLNEKVEREENMLQDHISNMFSCQVAGLPELANPLHWLNVTLPLTLKTMPSPDADILTEKLS